MEKTQLLIVHKHPIFRDALALELTRFKFQCHCADTTESAVRTCGIIKPDLLITEYNIKTIGGPQLVKLLLQKYSSLTAIGMSSHLTGYIVQDFREAGASGYIWLTMPDMLQSIIDVAAGEICFP